MPPRCSTQVGGAAGCLAPWLFPASSSLRLRMAGTEAEHNRSAVHKRAGRRLRGATPHVAPPCPATVLPPAAAVTPRRAWARNSQSSGALLQLAVQDTLMDTFVVEDAAGERAEAEEGEETAERQAAEVAAEASLGEAGGSAGGRRRRASPSRAFCTCLAHPNTPDHKPPMLTTPFNL